MDFDLPVTVPVGPAKVTLEFPDEAVLAGPPDDETLRRQREAVEKCWGIARHIGFSSDELLENRRGDLALEEAKRRRLFPPEDKA